MNLTIPGEPVPKARPRRGKGGVWYTPRESLAYEQLVGWHALQTGRKFKSGSALKVIADFYCSPRKPQNMPDLDNLLKSLLDGLQSSGCIENDRDVVAIEVYRWMDSKPRTEVIVEAFHEVDMGVPPGS